MTDSKARATQKRLVGLLILATLAALLYLVHLLREQALPFEQRFQVHAIVSRADTIRVGTPVTLAGISVGEVAALEITPDNRIQVVMEIEERFHPKIRRDSRATLINPLFGNPYIDIAIGSAEESTVEFGGEIPLAQSSGLLDLMTTLPRRLEQLDRILANHEALSERFLDPQGDLQQGVAHFNEGLGRFSALSRSLMQTEEKLQRSLANLERITGNTARVVGGVITTQGELNRILESVAVSLERLERSTEKFPDHAAEFAEILADMKYVAQHLRETTPRLARMVEEGRGVILEADRTLRASQRSFLVAPHLPKTGNEILVDVPRDPGLGTTPVKAVE
ncbi:MAG: hypothetical protein Kow006_08830 [Gammaproteobacteria bacterium]